MKVLRMLFGSVTREEARAIAREECERREWPWSEPVHVQRHLRTLHVMTNASHRGGNVNVWIDARSGEVIEAGFARR